MKRLFIAVMALILNVLMFSCTTDSIADTNRLYENYATEGDDGDIPPPPPPPK